MNDPKSIQVAISPVIKSIEVPLPIEGAFQLFTEGFGRWWPLATHSVGEEDAETCILEGWVSGQIFEIQKDGSRVDWGRVLTWEPPKRLVFSWHPGRTPDTAQEVEVAFFAAAGATRVELTHRGWESLGERAQTLRESYVSGWDTVLGKYIEGASSLADSAPLVKSVWVDLPVKAAFHLFTVDTGRWWPLATHSVGGEDAETCIIEGEVGGRFYEVQANGSQSEWGKVTVWEPNHKLVCTFYPGRTPEYATEVEVNFEAEAEGTRVTLIHRGWERCNEQVRAERKGYERGWEIIFGKYLEQAARL